MSRFVYQTTVARRRKKLTYGFLSAAVAMGTATTLVLTTVPSAFADNEPGTATAQGFTVTTFDDIPGTFDGDVVNVTDDLEGWSFEFDYGKLMSDGLITDDDSLSFDDESMEIALGEAQVLVRDITGFSLDEPADRQSFLDEAASLKDALPGYVEATSDGGTTDAAASPVQDSLETMLPLIDHTFDCRGRCLRDGTFRTVLLVSVMGLVVVGLNSSELAEDVVTKIEATMAVLGITVSLAQSFLARVREMTPEERELFRVRGAFSSFGTALTLLTHTLRLATDVAVDTNLVRAASLRLAREVVATGGQGAPADAAVIDIHDEL